MIGFPFDSHVTFESDGTPVYDRAITSAPLRKLIAKLLTDGVLPNPSTNLQVEAGSGMNVIVNPGFAICAGGLKLEENQRTLAIQAADSNYDRIDTVVLRWNDNDSERICDLYIVEGTPAASPLRPTLTRTESIWELGLADLFINKNSSAISNQRITDTRYETARCGIISAISEFDTTTLYQQVQADLAGFKASEQADFIAWFNDIKGQLSEDAAGNLQNQIGTLEALKTEVKTNLVNALNWVVDKTSGVIAKLGSADISKIGDGTVTGAIVNNKEAIEEVTQSLTTENGTLFRFGQNSDGEYGYIINKDGADTVIPFKKETTLELINEGNGSFRTLPDQYIIKNKNIEPGEYYVIISIANNYQLKSVSINCTNGEGQEVLLKNTPINNAALISNFYVARLSINETSTFSIIENTMSYYSDSRGAFFIYMIYKIN